MHLLPLWLLLAASALLPAPAMAALSQQQQGQLSSPNHAAAAKKPRVRAAAPAAEQTPAVVAAPGSGQAGYVHYWEITAPDGAEEIQVGIELPDQRIAWSFPGLGVHLTPFIAAGEVDAGGRLFKVRHLYGLRPFAQATAMRTLRSNLMRRVMPLARNRVPYCELNGVTGELCMSCMGFVAQVLFPGRTPEYAAFPRNFPRIAGEYYHTTEDLLLYLTGLHALPTDAARQRRIAAIGGPPALQEELARLTAILAAGPATTVADAGVIAKKPPKRRTRAAPKSPIKRAPKPG